MNKSNLVGLLVLSFFVTIFFSGFAHSPNDVKDNVSVYALDSDLLLVPLISSQSPSTLEVCTGDAISLFVIASGNGVPSYQWQKDGVDISTATSDNFDIAISSSSDAGIYQCIVSDVDGSTTSATTTVTVLSLPSINITGDLIICEGQTSTLTATGALSYDWGSGFTNQASFPVTPSASTNFPVIGQDSAGCSASASVLVEVIPTPTASVTSNGPICSGSDAQFIFSGNPDAVLTYKLNLYLVEFCLLQNKPKIN